MQLAFSLLTLLLGAVIAQAVFAAGLLWFARRNQPANRFLALLMGAIAGWVLDGFLRVAGIYGQRPDLYFLPIYYSLAFGPLLYFYVRSLVEHDFRFRPRHGWHFAPVAVQAVLYGALRCVSYADRTWFWLHVHRPVTYRVEFIGTWVSLLVYLALCLRVLRRYRGWLADHFSEVSRLRLTWLRTLLVVVGVVSVQWFAEVVMREFFGLYYQYDYSTELLGIVLLLVGVVGLRQADLEAVAIRAEEEADETPPGRPAPAGPLAPAVAPPDVRPAPDPALVARIRAALTDDRLYLNPALTLAELAAHVGANPKVVSAAINTGLGQTFNDLVNAHRVAEVKRRLRGPDRARLTLLGIALESGFNSKTTFNRIFKELTGQAPGEYQEPQ